MSDERMRELERRTSTFDPFHPFADGNARAARLWFEFLLRRGGVRVPRLVDVVRLEKVAGDPDLPWRMVRAAVRAYGL